MTTIEFLNNWGTIIKSNTSMKEGMITVMVAYPNSEGSTFDKDYYKNTHLPMAMEKIGPALKGLMLEFGVAGGAPGADASFASLATMYFDTIEDFQENFGPHAGEIMADLPNFTNSEPTIQISEIAMIAAG
ncbi:MAG: EthD family reductase [Balneolaceae bacterium]